MASPPRLAYKGAAQAESQVSWFDASMLYVRVTDCQQPLLVVPESLVMRFPARDIGVCMEVNGARIPPSEEVSLVLRCSRHSSSGEAPEAVPDYMYVSTDNLRTSSTLEFEVLEQAESVVVSGTLEKKLVEPNSRPRAQWAMVSSCEVGPDGCAFVKAKHELFKHAGMGASLPSVAGTAMEICVVGRFMGEPMILTHTVPLKRRHSFTSCGTLNAIPEDNEVDKPPHLAAEFMTMASLDFFDEGGEVPFFDMPTRNGCGDPTAEALAKCTEDFLSKAQLIKFDSSGFYLTDTDQEERWYKRGISTGIKVGLGIGIGMCIGVGIGLGLIIHKFRATTNSLKRMTL